jgi:hypothetical protein
MYPSAEVSGVDGDSTSSKPLYVDPVLCATHEPFAGPERAVTESRRITATTPTADILRTFKVSSVGGYGDRHVGVLSLRAFEQGEHMATEEPGVYMRVAWVYGKRPQDPVVNQLQTGNGYLTLQLLRQGITSRILCEEKHMWLQHQDSATECMAEDKAVIDSDLRVLADAFQTPLDEVPCVESRPDRHCTGPSAW